MRGLADPKAQSRNRDYLTVQERKERGMENIPWGQFFKKESYPHTLKQFRAQ